METWTSPVGVLQVVAREWGSAVTSHVRVFAAAVASL